jgi:hypothetical protein
MNLVLFTPDALLPSMIPDFRIDADLGSNDLVDDVVL